MKFSSSTIALGLAASVIATPTPTENNKPARVKRSLAAISSVIANIQSSVTDLDTAINAYKGGDVTAIQNGSDNIVSAVNDGLPIISSQDDLSIADASGLITPIQDLTADISKDITDLISKKSDLVAAGAGGQTYKDLSAQDTAAKALAVALEAKVPSALSSIAASLAGGVTSAIESGLSAFADVSTQTGGASPTTSSGAASTTSSSSAAATTSGGATPSSSAAGSSTPAPSTSPAPSTTYPAGTGTQPTGTGSPTTSASSTGTGSPPLAGAASFNSFSGVAAGLAAFAAIFAL